MVYLTAYLCMASFAAGYITATVIAVKVMRCVLRARGFRE